MAWGAGPAFARSARRPGALPSLGRVAPARRTVARPSSVAPSSPVPPMGAPWRRGGVPAAPCPLAAAPHGAFRHGIRQNIRQNICHWRLRCLRHASNDTTPRATRQSQQCRLAGPRRLRTRIIAVARRGMRGLMEDGMSSDDWQDVRGTPDDPNALRGKRVLIMGLGLLGGGVAAARYAVEQGAAEVVATDLRDEAVLAPSIAKLAGLPIRYVLRRHDMADFALAYVVMRDPPLRRDSAY